MITFIVTGDFVENAKLLDTQRLAKQRVEAIQILNAMTSNKGWSNHPITKAWKPFPVALKYYTNCIIKEFIQRGGKNNIPLFEVPKMILMPWWSQWDRLHQTHRMMLMRKNPFFYNFEVDPIYHDKGYIWPVPYSLKDAPLEQITAPIPKELRNPIYCTGILKSGKRVGNKCNRLIKDNGEYCTIHKLKTNILNTK